MNTNVVYKIINKINNKTYVGKTYYLPHRISLHKSRMKNEKYQSDLYKDMRKYGFDNFEFIILEYVENKEDLFKREAFWIKELDTFKNGYNKNEGKGGYGKGALPEESRKKLSKITIGENNPFYGKTHTKEVRQRINKNRTYSKETREKMSKSSKGPENAKGKKCILIIDDKEIYFNTLNKCYIYLRSNNLFPDYSFNSFVRWSRNNKLETKGFNYKIVEVD